ncbi:MAG: hypothetical protein ABI655_11710 [Phenylobacterium sp.]
MAHALKLPAPGLDAGIYWPRAGLLSLALVTNFALWALILRIPAAFG